MVSATAALFPSLSAAELTRLPCAARAHPVLSTRLHPAVQSYTRTKINLEKYFHLACNFRASVLSNSRNQAVSRRLPTVRQIKPISMYERNPPMTKATVKSLLMTAAISGLLSGATTTLSASTSSGNTGATSLTRALGLSSSSSYDDPKTEKHACKGQNSCKGKGGCKSGDNGCKGQNSCKGKGGCATDGSKPKAV
jgi:hypothetical protein